MKCIMWFTCCLSNFQTSCFSSLGYTIRNWRQKKMKNSGYPHKKNRILHTRYLYILMSGEYKTTKRKRQKHSPDSRVVATTRNMTTCRTRQTRYGSQMGAGERNACALIKLSEHFYFLSP